MPKNYKIRNPTTENHLVPLLPNQSFSLHISSWYGAVDLDWTENFLEVESKDQYEDGTTVICFKQKYDLTDWSKVSNFFLGEVLVIGNKTASLCVVLQTTNPSKENIVTVLDPMGWEMKIGAHQILEVVVSNVETGSTSQICEITCGKDQIEFEQIGHEITKRHVLPLNVNDVYCSLHRGIDSIAIEEHHYWFRINSLSMEVLNTLYDGVYDGGRIIFETRDTDELVCSFERSLKLMVSVKEKYKNVRWLPLLLPRKFSEVYFPAPFLERPRNRKKHQRVHMEQEIYLKKKPSFLRNAFDY